MSLQRSVTVDDTNKECQDLPVAVSEPLENEVCDNVVTKKIEKVPHKKCKTVQEKVCFELKTSFHEDFIAKKFLDRFFLKNLRPMVFLHGKQRIFVHT